MGDRDVIRRTRIPARRRSCIALVAAAVLLCVSAPAGRARAGARREHPFLLVRTSMYGELRDRAKRSPWKQMAAAASGLAGKRIPLGRWNTPMLARNVVSAATLSYVLDPLGRPACKAKLLEGVEVVKTLRIGGPNFSRQVPPGVLLVNLILALDVMHDDLSPAELAAAEAALAAAVNRVDRGWLWNKYTVHALWALYTGDERRFARNRDLYHAHFVAHTTEDGVWSEGINYASHRFAGQRDSKYLLMDVCEFTGTGEFYSKPIYRTFYEWLFGCGFTPMHGCYTFGDSPPNSRPTADGSAPFRACRFSTKAGGYAAFRLKGARPSSPPPRFHTFVLMDRPLPEPIKPASRIFPDGGACFVEDDQVTTSLAGTLWNCTKRGWHTHSDVNAIHLCAYGENILQNSGYVGAGSGTMGYTWNYISHEARANNTLLIDGKNHLIGVVCPNKGDWWHDPKRDGPHTKRGAGVTEGFTSRKLDYASGHSGKVLLGGTHERSFLFVHPQDGQNGYFVLFDEVEANSPAACANLVLHPNSHEKLPRAGCTTLRAGREYQWEINGNVRFHRDRAVKVGIFLGQEPSKVDLPLGLLSAWGSQRWQTVGRYLYATFETDPAGRANIPTVIYPFDAAHAKAAMSRLSGEGFCGVAIGQAGGVRDCAVAVAPGRAEAVSVAGVTFAGRSALFRLDREALGFYFARKARRLLAAGGKAGFVSDRPVSLHVKGLAGSIVSPGANVTFHHPGLAGLSLNGKPFAPLALAPGRLTATIPPGTHLFRGQIPK